MSINIRRDVKDAFYRYKMPKIIAKIEGKGNGIKTVVPNMSDVAKALNRPTTYPTKYFGCELGAQVKCEAKNDRYIINGAHDEKKLQTLLDGFITRFVLCESCKNPETDLIITKDDMIIRDCKACGERSNVDMRHKLTTFILKNPPATESGKKGKKSKKEKSANNSSSEATIPTPPDSASLNSEDDDEMTKKVTEEKTHSKKTKERKRNIVEEDDDDDWCEDTSPEAVAARMKTLNKAVAKLAVNITEEDEDDDEEDPLDVFAKFVEKGDYTNEEIVEEAHELGIRDDKACAVLAQIIFDENVLKQIPEKAPLLLKFVKNEKCQKGILGGIERLVVLSYPSLLSKVAFILKGLYDSDIIEEDVLLAWGEKPSKRYVEKTKSKEVRKQAAPFLNWLKEAEEESDEDDE